MTFNRLQLHLKGFFNKKLTSDIDELIRLMNPKEHTLVHDWRSQTLLALAGAKLFSL